MPKTEKMEAQSEKVQEQKHTILYMVRHTDVHNPGDILYGRLPRFRLSELGIQQAENTARVLAEEPLSTIYSSPRLRARQTAKIIAAPHPDARLRTTHMLDEVLTSWQGHPHSELAHITFNYYDNPLHPNDEDLDTVWHRVRRFITIARKRHGGQTITAVSHGDPVMLARAAYLGLPLKVSSLREPNVYAGKGSILRLVFPLDTAEGQPTEMAYYDPNSTGAPWSSGWVTLNPGQPLVHIA